MLSTVKNLFGEFMNVMIKKLLQGQAVEWRALGEVVKLEKGKQLNKELLFESGLYPAYNGGVSYSGFTDIYNYEENTIIISQGGASAGFVNFVTTKFYANAHCYVVLPKDEMVENRFIYHFLKLNQEKMMTKQHGAGIPALRTNEILNLKIPIPTLSVQSQIVQILDTFTELTAELTAELSMRQKQYQYYRDLLLSEHELAKVGFEWKTLGEVANYEQPTKYLVKSKDYDDDFKTPVLTAGKTFILGYTNETNGIYQASKNPVIIFDDFTTANKWVNFDFKAKSSAMKMISSVDENQFLLKYIYYWLNTLPSGLVDGDHKRQWISNFANKKIPIPPLSVQSQIVAILDTFDTLTQSISEGLPKEIQLRQTQYEYYRERLLNFKATI